METNYEDKAKELMTQGEENTEYKSLGKSMASQNVKETEKLDKYGGMVKLLMENLPSKGRFYPANTEIYLKPATVKEVKEFSTMDETDVFDVGDKLNNILIRCMKIDYNGRIGSYKDILEEDRIFIILSIRELTFKAGEASLKLPALCRKCDEENSLELATMNLQYHTVDSAIEKYYDAEERCFVITTKSNGTVRMAPPRIGVMKEITEYIRVKEEKGQKWSKDFMQVLPYMVMDWRGFGEKEIWDKEIEYQGWNINKYNLVFNLIGMMKVGVKQELTFPCENCGAEVTVPLTFPGGLKSLFVQSSITEELL